jgi:AAA15 family ATPase/GTPase
MSDCIIKQELNDELMLYQTDCEKVHVLNPTAKEIYSLYQDGKSITDILTMMQHRYDIQDVQQLRDDIENCIHQLKLQNIL